MADYQSVAATTVPLTLAECKRHLNVSSTADDTLLTEYIKAATAMLQKRCRRAFIHETRITKMRGFDDPRYVFDRQVVLPYSPLSSVSSIKYVASSGTTTTLPTSDYIVSANDRPGRISEAYSATWPDCRDFENNVTITYIAGHTSSSTGVPNNIKQALRHVVGEWYRNREMTPINWDVAGALLESEAIEQYG